MTELLHQHVKPCLGGIIVALGDALFHCCGRRATGANFEGHLITAGQGVKEIALLALKKGGIDDD